eukprot:TRINITY_DN1792_c0_g1_i1.p3 TRINITY_DN1792_c0_g1~~TRINITY_DN1792_c0_g1_i1.p3  ORF type:complete len:111 (+),score=1.27 TRINITY_DN1792_c0_g1_i1:901-1233(+)
MIIIIAYSVNDLHFSARATAEGATRFNHQVLFVHNSPAGWGKVLGTRADRVHHGATKSNESIMFAHKLWKFDGRDVVLQTCRKAGHADRHTVVSAQQQRKQGHRRRHMCQ